ncbi:unnamed protein product [Sphenostylis stenocarpa]|uniref:Uncharacterized protein n=1 Tax=Sphenostylis stenocarpa TaxID=92480 RepID=A0AA86SBZ0_9FABA|nr:unnamed protein product [Sphenostylis stenocarpa]
MNFISEGYFFYYTLFILSGSSNSCYRKKPGNVIRDCLTQPPCKNTPKGSQTQSQPQTHSKVAATNEDSSSSEP